MLVLYGVDIIVELGVLDLKVGLFHKMRDLLELVIGIIRMVKHDAVENLSEVGIKVELN